MHQYTILIQRIIRKNERLTNRCLLCDLDHEVYRLAFCLDDLCYDYTINILIQKLEFHQIYFRNLLTHDLCLCDDRARFDCGHLYLVDRCDGSRNDV